MNTDNLSGDVGGLLASSDPAAEITELELIRSRKRSLSFMVPDAQLVPQVHKVSPATRIDSASRPGATTVTLAPATVSPIRFRRRILLASAAAALLVGGIVVADVVLPARPGATAEAAEVLNNAAAATIQTSDPQVGPGQYLKIETIAVGSTGTVSQDGTHLSWLVRSENQVYVPADRNGEWVWNRGDCVPDTFFSEAAKVEATTRSKSLTSKSVNLAGIQRALRGTFYGTEQTVLNGMALDEISSLPRDPQALLNIIHERTKGDNTSPDEALITITETLRTGVIPADLRAAFYKAAALIPGVTLVDKQATLDGKTGIAIGVEYADGGARQEIIIDPTTGLMIGERNVALKPTADFPAGTATSWTSVRTSVVDAAP